MITFTKFPGKRIDTLSLVKVTGDIQQGIFTRILVRKVDDAKGESPWRRKRKGSQPASGHASTIFARSSGVGRWGRSLGCPGVLGDRAALSFTHSGPHQSVDQSLGRRFSLEFSDDPM